MAQRFLSYKIWHEGQYFRATIKLTLIFLSLFCLCLPTANATGKLGSQSSQYLPDRVIVKFATGSVAGPRKASLQSFAMPGEVSQILANFGAAETEQLFPLSSRRLQKRALQHKRIDLSSIYEIRLAHPADVMKLVQLLRQQPGVVYAEPVYIRQLCYNPNDPSIGSQSYLTNIKAREAWDVTRGDTSVVIAIVDTGVDWSHPDLAANIWRNYDEIPNNRIDDDRNGKTDDIRGWDFGGNGTEDNNPREDTPTHGTFVAGCAAAVTDNNIGVSGVGFRSKIMPVKASRSGSDGIFSGYSGIVYAAENGADIINCSWGGCGYSQLEQEVIDYATELGALVVAAAGNDNVAGLFYPAAYRNVLAVGSTNGSDRKSSFSNYGYWLDVMAPGQNMYNTWQPNTYASGYLGTSFSSPVVAGVAALVKAVHKDWPPQAIAEQVRLAADNIDNINVGYERQLGSGRLNALKAVTLQNLSAVRLVSYSAVEANGDGDGIFDPNEEIALSIKLTNHLEPANNLTVSLVSASPYASILSGSKNLNRIGRGDTIQINGTFNFRINANAPSNHQAIFHLNFSTTGYEDWQGFSVLLRAPHVDLLAGNVATTITNFGALGFYDYAECGFGLLGRGFEFPLGSASALYHGGLLLATASNRVSDVSYGNDDPAAYNYDFITASGGEINIGPGRKSTVEATARFNDSAAGAPIGLTVEQKAFAWDYAPWNDFVILEFTIQNTTQQTINNLYAGYYLDWDINKSEENFAGWDNVNQLGYEWANASAYYGITAILPNRAASYRAVKNPDFVWDGFTDANKYQFMTGGFQVTSSDEPNDWSQLLSYGPFSLAAGKTVTVAFAILGGINLADLQANARASRDAYTALSVGIDSPNESAAPLRFELAQNTPNPFANRVAVSTEIRYSLAEPGAVTLRIFNLLGQEVAVLMQTFQDRGSYVAQWNGRDRRGLVAPSGVYFYQLKTPAFTATRKLIVVE